MSPLEIVDFGFWILDCEFTVSQSAIRYPQSAISRQVGG